MIPLDGASRIELRTSAGSLRVIGEPGLSDVRIEGIARASDQRTLDGIDLVAERRGEVLYVASRMPRARSGRWFGFGVTYSPALDLTITIPAGTPVVATDGSGSAQFRGTGPLRVRDGSGELTVQDVLGEVDITDGSGRIVVRNVSGPLRIRDGSGSILVDGVGEEVTIHDGSGAITVSNAGHVRIASNRSGAIGISDATGHVTIDETRSGAISVRRVGGDFTIHRARTRNIHHEGVQGQVTLPRRSRR